MLGKDTYHVPHCSTLENQCLNGKLDDVTSILELPIKSESWFKTDFSLTSFDLSILIHKKQMKNNNAYSGNINSRNIIFKYKEGRDFFNHLFKRLQRHLEVLVAVEL